MKMNSKVTINLQLIKFNLEGPHMVHTNYVAMFGPLYLYIQPFHPAQKIQFGNLQAILNQHATFQNSGHIYGQVSKLQRSEKSL